MIDSPAITQKEFEEFLKSYIPENIYTLGLNILVFIDSNVEQRRITISHATSNLTFNISCEDIYAFYLIVSELESFRTTDYMHIYKGPKNQISGLLSIIKNVMEFYEISYDKYIKPGENKNNISSQVLGALNTSINILKETGASKGYINKRIMEHVYSPNSIRNIMKQTLIKVSEVNNIAAVLGENNVAAKKTKYEISDGEIFNNESLEKSSSDEILINSFLEMKESHPYSEIDVFYVTNRQHSPNKNILYRNERDADNTLQYGKAVISIPDEHNKGQVERPIFKLTFAENKKKHFTVLDGSIFDKESFFESIKKDSGKSAMIFIHGFNVSFKDGLLKTAQIKKDLQYKDPIILFSWPSKAKIPLYTHDQTNADFSSEDFKTLVEQLSNKGIESIYIIAHSMGAYCASMGLCEINPGELPNLKNLIFAAPDIDIGTFKKKYAAKLSKLFNNITIYMSKSDVALTLSEHANGYERLGDTTHGVSVFEGIDSIDATGVDNSFSLRHSYVSEEPLLIHDLIQLIFNKQKPEKRGLIKSKNTFSQLYWRFI